MGATLLRNLAVKHEWNSFLDLAAVRLDALEFHDFEQEETNSFKMLMTRDGDELQKKRCFGGIYQKTQEVKFMASKISTHVSCINDAWALPLAARLRTVACNTGALAMFPWEKALHTEPGNIDGVRSALQIPEALLSEYVNCREAALSILEGVSHGSLHDWKKALNSQYKALVALDRTWQLDADYLNNNAEKDIIKELHSDLLSMLPSPENVKKIEAVIDCMKLIKNTPLALAGGERGGQDHRGRAQPSQAAPGWRESRRQGDCKVRQLLQACPQARRELLHGACGTHGARGEVRREEGSAQVRSFVVWPPSARVQGGTVAEGLRGRGASPALGPG